MPGPSTRRSFSNTFLATAHLVRAQPGPGLLGPATAAIHLRSVAAAVLSPVTNLGGTLIHLADDILMEHLKSY